MAQILNKIKANIYDYLVSRLEARLSFKTELAEIKRDEFEDKAALLTNKYRLKMKHQLATYEMKANIQSDYVNALLDAKLKKTNHRYELRTKIVEQKVKRAKNENRKKRLLAQLNQITINHKEAIRLVKEKHQGISPSKEDITEYKTQLHRLQSELDQKVEMIQSRFTLKKAKLDKKLASDQAKDRARIKNYTNKLISLEETLKHNNKNVILEDDIALSVRELSMHFGGLKAVDRLSFDVKRGEIFGLIGPNGAGKTTVFNCITKFYKPTSGRMYFRNANQKTVNLNQVAVHNVIKEGIVRTFQNVELVWELNILDNLLVAAHSAYRSKFFGHLVHSRLTKREESIFTKRAMKILTDLKLTDYMFAYPIGLPYGILKKIELARTLMTHPQMIILDEPAAGLNDAETKELASVIQTIREEYGLTVFLVEHDMGLVMSICDTVCAISFGKKLALGSPKEIQQSKVVREAYLGGE